MKKLKLEIDDLAVHSFSVSATAHGGVESMMANGGVTGWCTLFGQCPSWFICAPEPVNTDV